MITRKAKVSDISGISKLIEEASGYGILLQRTEQELHDDLDEFWVMEDNDKIIACCALDIYSKKLAEIRSMAVRESYQGQGIASILLDHCIQEAKDKGVYEVLTITNRANIFRKKGFAEQLDGQTALLLRP